MKKRVIITNRDELILKINLAMTSGKESAAIFDAITLGINDGHDGVSENDCPLHHAKTQEVWRQNVKVGQSNRKKLTQPDLFSTHPLSDASDGWVNH